MANMKVVSEEDPWEKKRRIEKKTRRREAERRARGMPVNNRRPTVKNNSCGNSSGGNVGAVRGRPSGRQ